jgi:bisphosphoglycerate-dependent phosphoglycerate mutase
MVYSAWLIRHGESTWNALGLAQGHCDQARLTRHGEHQAWAVVGTDAAGAAGQRLHPALAGLAA